MEMFLRARIYSESLRQRRIQSGDSGPSIPPEAMVRSPQDGQMGPQFLII